MNRQSQFVGIAALVVIVFSLIAFLLISAEYSWLAISHLVLGLALGAFYIVGGGLGSLFSEAGRRVAGFGINVSLYSSLFIGVLLLANFFAARHELFRFDSTEEKVYTLAPQTTEVLTNLAEDLKLRAFYVGGLIRDPRTEDLLNRIDKASPRVSLEVIDPESKPTLVEKFGINSDETLHLSFGQGDAIRQSKLTRNVGEQEIVNAILKLTRGASKIAYYLTGHGEPELDDPGENGYLFAKEALEGENLELRPLELLNTGTVPEDASLLIIASPKRDFVTRENQAIKAYLDAGGSAVFLHEPRTSETIRNLVSGLGIEVGKNVIVDQVLQLFAGPTLGVQPMVQIFEPHPITQSFEGSTGALFSIASSVTKAESNDSGAQIVEFAKTSSSSWAESNVELIFGAEPQAALEDSDIRGPVSIAVAYEKRLDHEQDAEKTDAETNPLSSRIVVFGDADFITNLNIRELYNRDLFLNAANWAVGEEQGVTIRARSLRESTESITAEQFNKMFLFTGFLAPEFLLLAGLSVWWTRRSKR